MVGAMIQRPCLAVGRMRFFRQLYNLLQTDTQPCPYDPEDLLADILYQSSYAELDKTFDVLLDNLRYPNTAYGLGFGQLLVQSAILLQLVGRQS